MTALPRLVQFEIPSTVARLVHIENAPRLAAIAGVADTRFEYGYTGSACVITCSPEMAEALIEALLVWVRAEGEGSKAASECSHAIAAARRVLSTTAR